MAPVVLVPSSVRWRSCRTWSGTWHIYRTLGDTIRYLLLFLQLSKLLNGNKVEIPQYDYTKHVRRKKTLCVETSKIIILDGTLIYSRLELVELIDIKIFIDSPDAKRLKFRQRRDVLERGRTVDSINEQYSKTVRPMYDKFVYPSKKYANIIINDPSFYTCWS